MIQMPLSPEAIHEFFKASTFPKERQIVVHTGQAGMQLFNIAIQEEALRIEKAENRKLVRSLFKRKLIAAQQKKSLLMMIDSPDSENYEVAKAILNIKH